MKAQKITVYSGHYYRRGKRHAACLATTSQTRAAKILGISIYSLRKYWAVTRSHKMIEAATAKPNKILYKHEGNYVTSKAIPAVKKLKVGVSGQYKWQCCPACKRKFEVEVNPKKGGSMLSTYNRHVTACERKMSEERGEAV